VAIVNPSEQRRRASVILAAGYRPSSLKDFLQKSVFTSARKTGKDEDYAEAAVKVLETIKENEGISREKWEDLVKLSGFDQASFYNVLFRRLRGLGMIRVSSNKYYVSSEFSTMLEWIDSLWKVFRGDEI